MSRATEFLPELYDDIAPGYYDKVYRRGRGVHQSEYYVSLLRKLGIEENSGSPDLVTKAAAFVKALKQAAKEAKSVAKESKKKAKRH